MIVNRDISERKRAEEMLAHNAFHDGLTNLPNRALFLDRLQRALVLSKRHPDYKFAVLFIDVDEFKVFNDSLGHKVGDEVLVQIGQRLTASLREVDTIARPQLGPATRTTRWPGSVAMNTPILLEDIRNPSDAIRVAERLQARLAVPFYRARIRNRGERQRWNRLEHRRLAPTLKICCGTPTSPCIAPSERARRAAKSSTSPCMRARSGVWNWRRNFAKPWSWANSGPTTSRSFP